METAKCTSITYQDLKKALPEDCLRINPKTSWLYLSRDITAIVSLGIGATFITEQYYLWPLYWLAQGTFLFALFLIGHDCGHGSFSKHSRINTFIGHICMTPTLIPFNSWRISHNAHHANVGHATKEDAWQPYTKEQYERMRGYERVFRHTIFLIFAMPLYMMFGTAKRRGSHYSPSCSLFRAHQKHQVLTSTTAVLVMVLALTCSAFWFNVYWTIMLYIIPYIVFVIWLSAVTFLHHTDAKIPWYTGKEWNFLKGALATKDRTYGIFNWFIHNIGTHVSHHLFPTIPHYHLKKATHAISPLIGSKYIKSKKFALLDLTSTIRHCRFIEKSTEDTHFYKSK